MPKVSSWSAVIFDKEEFNMGFYRGFPVLDFLSFLSRKGYNVTERKAFNVNWLGSRWDELEVITEYYDSNLELLRGFRLALRSQYLNAYYAAREIALDTNKWKDYFHESGYFQFLVPRYKKDIDDSFIIEVDFVSIAECNIKGREKLSYEECCNLYMHRVLNNPQVHVFRDENKLRASARYV